MLETSLSPVQPKVIPPHESQAAVRRIIAQKWDVSGQSIDSRSLVLWPIIDSLGRVTHCVIGIDGTPWRGIAFVSMQGDERAVRTSTTSMALRRKDIRILRAFISMTIDRESRQ